MSNHLKDQTSPYLLQHAENPVNWYPWCEEAFQRARAENKPVFLSIGYSTCHWCHVMAHESFENPKIAELLNSSFISIKVDREERPDVDAIYMAVCQAFTGSGGWPTSIFMTPEQKPFFAGTYYPPVSQRGMIGFSELLQVIHEKWETEQGALLESAERMISEITVQTPQNGRADRRLSDAAMRQFRQSFDRENGGFGNAPKFPSAHNLLFLLGEYEKRQDNEALEMAELTLTQMFRGGLFDHIGGGFCRYSTDRYFLAPHFEKMLYDNALLILAYAKAYSLTKKPLYLKVAQNAADYLLREMTVPEGGFCSAQDADSDGVEGKFYLFEPQEILAVLGEKTGEEFNRRYDITAKGNFEGSSIPNLLQSKELSSQLEACLPTLWEYRRKRNQLHRDDKILTAWNGLTIGALCSLYRISGEERYLQAAEKAWGFLEEHVSRGDSLFVSLREGKQGELGFLDDYAFVAFGLLSLYEAALERGYLQKAQLFCQKVLRDFEDEVSGGFYFYGKGNERLIFRPKETYDGAMPSGNSMMARNLVALGNITGEKFWQEAARRQMEYMAGAAENTPAGHTMFLTALEDHLMTPERVVIVVKDSRDLKGLSRKIPQSATIILLDGETREYPLKNQETTFYICKNHSCLPPTNALEG